jgi:DNA-binding CsgD family transcriptional regulator
MDIRVSGEEFKAIRERCGYRAREVAEFLHQKGIPGSVSRSVYRLEERDDVPWRYIEALRELVGPELFQTCLDGIRHKNTPETDTITARPLTRERIRHRQQDDRQNDDDHFAVDELRLINFLNNLPTTGNALQWVTRLRTLLRDLFDEVDHVVINLNLDCDLDHPQLYSVDLYTTEHFAQNHSTVVVSTVDNALPPADRLLANFRSQGYPLDQYHPCCAIDCYFEGTAYIGTVFFWREKVNPPFSQQGRDRLARLRPFLNFLLSYIVARNQQQRPQDRMFNDAMSFMVQSAGLTDQERRVAVLLLYGHTYEEVSERLNLSVDTIRKHVKGIYRKTGTHSGPELFAKYFTPRLGF